MIRKTSCAILPDHSPAYCTNTTVTHDFSPNHDHLQVHRSAMLNRLKAAFRWNPFNRAPYFMSAPAQLSPHSVSPPGQLSQHPTFNFSDANLCFRVDDLAGMTPEVAIFAGGCFWGVEHIFLKHYPPEENKGILKTKVGFTGGKTGDTNYREVSSGTTEHAEALRIEFDPTIVSYAELVGEWAVGLMIDDQSRADRGFRIFLPNTRSNHCR